MKKDDSSLTSEAAIVPDIAGGQIEEENDNDEELARGCGCNKILAVDDNDFNLITLRGILEAKFRLRCDVAINGRDAVNKFRASLGCCPYRLIFMDVNMPVLDGKDATREIRQEIQAYTMNRSIDTPDAQRIRAERVSNIYIAALTANNNPTDMDECLQAGMDCYLSKPADYLQLKVVLEQVDNL